MLSNSHINKLPPNKKYFIKSILVFMLASFLVYTLASLYFINIPEFSFLKLNQAITNKDWSLFLEYTDLEKLRTGLASSNLSKSKFENSQQTTQFLQDQIAKQTLFKPNTSNFNQLLQKEDLFLKKELNLVQVNVSKNEDPIILSLQKESFWSKWRLTNIDKNWYQQENSSPKNSSISDFEGFVSKIVDTNWSQKLISEKYKQGQLKTILRPKNYFLILVLEIENKNNYVAYPDFSQKLILNDRSGKAFYPVETNFFLDKKRTSNQLEFKSCRLGACSLKPGETLQKTLGFELPQTDQFFELSYKEFLLEIKADTK